MINKPVLNTQSLPFCKGCGHDLIAKNMAKAIEKSNIPTLDIVLVTDIGCHGIIDKAFNTHTVHGLHGRSVALGAGITFALADAGKKVVVFLGDGGATIGLQHIIEASRMNLNMMIVIHNNMLYGMTGGQTSGLTPTGFRTTTAGEGNPFSAHDLCALSHTAGASLSTRITGIGDYSDKLASALNSEGCSLVEIVEICPSYGVKLNPGRKLSEIMESMGHPEGTWRNARPGYRYNESKAVKDLTQNLPVVESQFKGNLASPYSVILTGSAGEGVQLAASILSRASLSSGLHVTQKGSYPVTVGVGFSTAELNISPDEINYNGMQHPDAILVTSLDGLNHNLKRINMMKKGLLIIDSSLDVPDTGATVHIADFRSTGSRNAAIASLLRFTELTSVVGRDSINAAIEGLGLGEKVHLAEIDNKLSQSKGL
jgi:2-oxoglutarate/2-oxoacid ferredoxin oxidoreductase subunit beta